jgi:hypothetical protein
MGPRLADRSPHLPPLRGAHQTRRRPHRSRLHPTLSRRGRTTDGATRHRRRTPSAAPGVRLPRIEPTATPFAGAQQAGTRPRVPGHPLCQHAASGDPPTCARPPPLPARSKRGPAHVCLTPPPAAAIPHPNPAELDSWPSSGPAHPSRPRIRSSQPLVYPHHPPFRPLLASRRLLPTIVLGL